jgi:tripartite-type tricarboxylate transporter receptor subunit TctC
MFRTFRGATAAACLLLLALGTAALAQTFPDKPIRLVIGLAPGGVGDITARAVAKKMSESLGQPVVVDNKPGAGQILGLNLVAKAPPDGYSLVIMGAGNASTQLLFKELPWDVMKDFTYVSTLAFYDIAVVTAANSPFQNLQDLVKAAKARPGKLNIGTINIGSTQNLTAELFKSVAGVDVAVVPYKSTAEVVAALMAGDVQAGVEMIPPIIGQIKGKSLKPLALMATKRFPGLPDVPTAAESGYPALVAASWNGIAAPANTPAPIVEKLNKAIRDAVASPEVTASFRELGVDARSSAPGEMRELMRTDLPKWKAVIDSARIPRQ